MRQSLFLKKILGAFCIAILISPTLVNGQRKITKVQTVSTVRTRLLLCNQKNTVQDTVRLPAGGIIAKGEKIAAWRYLVSKQKGVYRFSLSSDFPFLIVVRRRTGTDGRWTVINSSKRSRTAPSKSGGATYYFWNSLRFTQRYEPKRNLEFTISARPSKLNQKFTARWYTSGCKKSEQDPKTKDRCVWARSSTLFGVSHYECRCGGKVVNKRRCGR